MNLLHTDTAPGRLQMSLINTYISIKTWIDSRQQFQPFSIIWLRTFVDMISAGASSHNIIMEC